MNEIYGKYGLPLNVEYCSRCTVSNQRPSSTIEFRSMSNVKKNTITIDTDHICSACKFSEMKKSIDWNEREKEFKNLCDSFRRSDGRYDVIVPGSGGKDSVQAAHMLKFKYNMNPILITWPPAIYTSIGRANYEAWLDSGFANYTYWQNRKLHRFLTRQSFLNLGHPFQPFILGQKNFAPKLSVLLDIPLVIYGENEAEYGNAIEENYRPTRDRKYYSIDQSVNDITLAGIAAEEIITKHGFKKSDLEAYFPTNIEALDRVGTEVDYLGYYVKWHPQQTYYYAVENTDFMPNPERTEGSYSKYSSLDDKIDWLHYHTTYAKFGLGRATYDSAQEIRNGDITRDDGIALVKRFDGEFPEKYLDDCCKYMGITRDEYTEVIDRIRSPHLWENHFGHWQLKHPIWQQ